MPNMTDEIDRILKEFPEEFGLRNFPGEVFRVDRGASYYSEFEGAVLLYTFRKCGDEWRAFAKGTVSELRREIVIRK